MPGTDGQDLLALQKAIHSSNHQSNRQKDWHPEKMTEIQPHVSGIITSPYSNIWGTLRTFSLVNRKIAFDIISHPPQSLFSKGKTCTCSLLYFFENLDVDDREKKRD